MNVWGGGSAALLGWTFDFLAPPIHENHADVTAPNFGTVKTPVR